MVDLCHQFAEKSQLAADSIPLFKKGDWMGGWNRGDMTSPQLLPGFMGVVIAGLEFQTLVALGWNISMKGGILKR